MLNRNEVMECYDYLVNFKAPAEEGSRAVVNMALDYQESGDGMILRHIQTALAPTLQGPITGILMASIGWTSESISYMLVSEVVKYIAHPSDYYLRPRDVAMVHSGICHAIGHVLRGVNADAYVQADFGKFLLSYDPDYASMYYVDHYDVWNPKYGHKVMVDRPALTLPGRETVLARYYYYGVDDSVTNSILFELAHVGVELPKEPSLKFKVTAAMRNALSDLFPHEPGYFDLILAAVDAVNSYKEQK